MAKSRGNGSKGGSGNSGGGGGKNNALATNESRM